MRSRRAPAVLAFVLGGLLAACGGSPPDLGNIQPAEAIPNMPGPWKVVTVEGMTVSAVPIEALKVEVDPDGRAVTAFFLGGDPSCYAVSGLEVEHRNPAPPAVTVLYGLRLGNMGCNAALYSLAIRVPMEPPLEP
jgi:hypothetical protein